MGTSPYRRAIGDKAALTRHSGCNAHRNPWFPAETLAIGSGTRGSVRARDAAGLSPPAGEELAEAAFIAAAVRAGGTLAHSLMALRLFDEGSGAG
jgi:hypothetical protein